MRNRHHAAPSDEAKASCSLMKLESNEEKPISLTRRRSARVDNNNRSTFSFFLSRNQVELKMRATCGILCIATLGVLVLVSSAVALVNFLEAKGSMAQRATNPRATIERIITKAPAVGAKREEWHRRGRRREGQERESARRGRNHVE